MKTFFAESGLGFPEVEPDAEPRADRHVSFRLSVGDHDELATLADQRGKTVSQLLRDLVQGELARNRDLGQLDSHALSEHLGGVIAEVQRRLAS